MWFLADSCDMKRRPCLSQSVERRLHHLVGPDERGLMMAVTRGEVCVFLCQLLGFQPDTGQRGRDHDLILKRSFSPERSAKQKGFQVKHTNDKKLIFTDKI